MSKRERARWLGGRFHGRGGKRAGNGGQEGESEVGGCSVHVWQGVGSAGPCCVTGLPTLGTEASLFQRRLLFLCRRINDCGSGGGEVRPTADNIPQLLWNVLTDLLKEIGPSLEGQPRWWEHMREDPRRRSPVWVWAEVEHGGESDSAVYVTKHCLTQVLDRVVFVMTFTVVSVLMDMHLSKVMCLKEVVEHADDGVRHLSPCR